jgi:hypothetical protein
MDLAGPPFHLDPSNVVKNWTLPQVLLAWVRKLQDESESARQSIMLRMTAIGGVMSKEGGKHARDVIRQLEGPALTTGDLIDQLPDEAKLVMFGRSRLGSSGNTDQDQG